MNTKDTHREALEQAELDLLNATPARISIQRRPRRPRGLWQWIRTRLLGAKGDDAPPHAYTLEIPPLTLGTILRISQEGARLELPRDLPQGLEGLPDLSHHWASVTANAHRLGRIVSIASLGGRATEREIDELSQDILESITAGELASLCVSVLTSADLVNFTNSIRLMRASRVTNPDLIEHDGASGG